MKKKVVSKKNKSIIRVRVGQKNPSLGITVCHHSASIVMQNGDPRDKFLYPTRPPPPSQVMMNTYILLGKQER